MAQNFVNKFFEQERAALATGALLTANFQRDFLKDMANFFKGCSKHISDDTGMVPLNTTALLKAKVEDQEPD